jgi:SAM-dependent methyltransferase
MSPKKAHEVDRLSKLIDQTYDSSGSSTRLIVDVGAGQGYLSHRLAETTGTRVLALDGDEGQTEGASLRGQGLSHAQRQKARQDSGSDEQGQQAVTHRTLFITSDSLLHAVDKWVSGLGLETAGIPYPVLVTGLHACGSLTPAVLRCFIDLYVGANNSKVWRPSALALVGCCYNLMRDSGAPLCSPCRYILTPGIQQVTFHSHK